MMSRYPEIRRWAPLLLAAVVTVGAGAAPAEAHGDGLVNGANGGRHVNGANGRRIGNGGLANGNGRMLNGSGGSFNGNGRFVNRNGRPVNGQLAAPPGAQVEVFVDGELVFSTQANARLPLNGNGGVVDGNGGAFVNGNGELFVNGGRLVNRDGAHFVNGNGRQILNGNGRRFLNGMRRARIGNRANGAPFIDGDGALVDGDGAWIFAEGNVDPDARWGEHSKTHFGAYSECRFHPNMVNPDGELGMGVCSRSRTGWHRGSHKALFTEPRDDEVLGF